MQMYLVLPVLFVVARRAARSSWFLAYGDVCCNGFGSHRIYLYHLTDLLIYVPCFAAGIVA
jgi:hypothetical protein